MSKEEILNYFYTNNVNLGVGNICMIMLAGLLVAMIIYMTYWASSKKVSYNSKFNITLVLVCLISIIIMLMISSNIVISLGMVGALSIIRFRTAIKDSRDTVFIFWAITEGLCVGSQNFKLSIITTLFLAILMLIIGFIPKLYSKYLIVISGDKNKLKSNEVKDGLKPFVKTMELRTMTKNEDSIEMIFEIKTRGEIKLKSIDAISSIDGVKSVNWIIESGDTIG